MAELNVPKSGPWFGVPFSQNTTFGQPLSPYANVVDQVYASQQPMPTGRQFPRWNFGWPQGGPALPQSQGLLGQQAGQRATPPMPSGGLLGGGMPQINIQGGQPQAATQQPPPAQSGSKVLFGRNLGQQAPQQPAADTAYRDKYGNVIPAGMNPLQFGWTPPNLNSAGLTRDMLSGTDWRNMTFKSPTSAFEQNFNALMQQAGPEVAYAYAFQGQSPTNYSNYARAAVDTLMMGQPYSGGNTPAGSYGSRLSNASSPGGAEYGSELMNSLGMTRANWQAPTLTYGGDGRSVIYTDPRTGQQRSVNLAAQDVTKLPWGAMNATPEQQQYIQKWTELAMKGG